MAEILQKPLELEFYSVRPHGGRELGIKVRPLCLVLAGSQTHVPEWKKGLLPVIAV